MCSLTKHNYLWFIILISSFEVFGQSGSNLRYKNITGAKALQIDTLSLVPQSVDLFYLQHQIATTKFRVDYVNSYLFITDSTLINKNIQIAYRVFPFSFSQPIPKIRFNPEISKASKELSTAILPGYQLTKTPYENRLQINGNISRSIGAGNNQNLAVESDMNLQMSGLLSENLKIDALLSDNNIPIQPEGYSQQIQEFDQVYIRIYDSLKLLQMGDIEIKNGEQYFLKFNKKIQGAQLAIKKIPLGKKAQLHTISSVAIAKGKFNRYEFNGIEGVQGPYKLYGANNERFVMVLAGSEKIYLNGQLLKRGESADYVMNYNTAELTFSPNLMITKDARIIAEFEYSDQNYNRFILHSNNSIALKKSTYCFEIYKEGDAKNQPINLDLTDKNRTILQNAGDNPMQAIISGIDSTGFDANRVLYRMTDTLINQVLYDSVLVQSYNAAEAFYSASFSLVDSHNGNYIQVNTNANGKVFQWVAPVNNIPQGNYEPVQVLIAPKKKQIVSAKATYQLPANTQTGFEVALSNNDKNTLSQLDGYDNQGLALKSWVSKDFLLKTATLNSQVSYQWISKYFNPVERFRNPEFNRDWNLTTPILHDEQFLQAQLGWSKNKNSWLLNQEILSYGQTFEGLRTNIKSNLNFWGFYVNGKFSLLNSRGNTQNTQFYRHTISVKKNISRFTAGVSHDFENNLLHINTNDSLLAGSQKYSLFQLFIKTQDTVKQKAGLSYIIRQDYLPEASYLKLATQANDVVFNAQLAKNQQQQLKSKIILRQLKVIRPGLLINTKPDKNVLGTLDYKLRTTKRWLSLSNYYEIGTGMETKKEFSFFEVAAGQGNYEWIDYNNNNIPELGEFEVSLNPETANFIKIYTPTDDYIKVYGLRVNESVRFDPLTLWRNKKGVRKFISRFTNVFNYQMQQKQTFSDLVSRTNPFNQSLADTALITKSVRLRNTLSVNRSNSKFGMDYIYSNGKQKSLLSNGFDQNTSEKHEIKIRWNVNAAITFLNNSSMGIQYYSSEFFAEKNHQIKSLENAVTTKWQPTAKYRVSIFYCVKSKTNLLGNQKVLFQEIGPALKFNTPKKGTINCKASLIFNNYVGETQSSISYLMLEGFQPGQNFRWSVNVSRNINNFLRLTVNYQGRKPAGLKMNHIGQLSLSAYF